MKILDGVSRWSVIFVALQVFLTYLIRHDVPPDQNPMFLVGIFAGAGLPLGMLIISFVYRRMLAPALAGAAISSLELALFLAYRGISGIIAWSIGLVAVLFVIAAGYAVAKIGVPQHPLASE